MASITTAEVQQLRDTLEEWRGCHCAPTPIPDEIWSRAARLAVEHGVGPVSRELRLDHGKLKRLAEECRALVPTEAEAKFIEFRPVPAGQFGQPTSPLHCLVEVESAAGPRMRAELDGVSPLELAAIFREFAR